MKKFPFNKNRNVLTKHEVLNVYEFREKDRVIKEEQSKLVKYLQVYLKEEWNRVKEEAVKGNIKS